MMTTNKGTKETQDNSAGQAVPEMSEAARRLEERLLAAFEKTAGVAAWYLTTTELARDEVYVIGREIEQTRSVARSTASARVYVDEDSAEGPMTGNTRRAFTADMDQAAIDEQVAEMVFAAKLALNPRYRLDEPRQNGTVYPNCDPVIARDRRAAMQQIVDRTIAQIAKEDNVKIASSEVFLTHTVQHERNSMGLDHREASTRIMFELVLIAGEGEEEVESHLLLHERYLDKLNIEDVVSRYAQYARDNLTATLPKSGKFNVIFTEESLFHFFDYFQNKSFGAVIYNKMSDWEVGRTIIDDAVGDKLTISYDPFVEGGMSTSKYDHYGTLLEKTTFIEDNVFTKIVADKRHADYLGVPVTGMGSNIVVEGGTSSYDDLLEDGTFVLSRFSSFTPNAMTGGFSGEIRNGLFYDKGTFHPVKGGSVSGMIAEVLKDARFSKETIQLGRYLGPRYIKVRNVDIAGE